MNRTIKEGIQIANLQGKDPTTVTKERLLIYHTTPNTITNKTPFELMRGRPGRTKLYTSCSNSNSDYRDIQDSIANKQLKYKKIP